MCNNTPWRVCLGDEFGKEYGTYFSILSGIARGLTTRPQIENALGIEIGGFGAEVPVRRMSREHLIL